jgi:phosphate transport system substrate-binding protein
VVNLAGIKAGQLVLDGPTLAAIYDGEIAQWNDPRIKALNPKLALPNQAIAPVYRSDGSGTNFLFTYYLSKVSPSFRSKVGANTSVDWPSGIGAKGNEGVANMTAVTSGAIGYVEYAYAKQNAMTSVLLKNQDGKIVAPEASAFQAAAASADWSKAPGYYLVLVDQAGAASWPITGASFILVHATPKDPVAVASALTFFAWAYASGGDMAAALDYVPLPPAVVKMVENTWVSSITSGGKPVWTGK